MIERINNEELKFIYGGMKNGKKKSLECAAGMIGGYLGGWVSGGPIGATIGAVSGGFNCARLGLQS